MARRSLRFKVAFALLAVGLTRGAWLASAGPGYLPTVGPVPVRFQTASLAPSPFLWPPLVAPEQLEPKADAPATNAPVTVAPVSDLRTNTPPAPIVISTAPPPAPPLVSPFPLALPSQPEPGAEGVPDPQMSLHYLLTVSTNASGTKIIMPAFVPPPPPASRSSQATYESR